MDYCREDGPREGFFNLRVGPSQWQWCDREVTLAFIFHIDSQCIQMRLQPFAKR